MSNFCKGGHDFSQGAKFNGVKCSRFVHNDSLGIKFSLYAQRHDWHKIFPLGIKAIFPILRQSMYDPDLKCGFL